MKRYPAIIALLLALSCSSVFAINVEWAEGPGFTRCGKLTENTHRVLEITWGNGEKEYRVQRCELVRGILIVQKINQEFEWMTVKYFTKEREAIKYYGLLEASRKADELQAAEQAKMMTNIKQRQVKP